MNKQWEDLTLEEAIDQIATLTIDEPLKNSILNLKKKIHDSHLDWLLDDKNEFRYYPKEMEDCDDEDYDGVHMQIAFTCSTGPTAETVEKLTVLFSEYKECEVPNCEICKDRIKNE